MKCKVCGGTGTSNTCVNGTFKPCTFCDGTGEYEPFDADVELDKLYPTEQTNEEWLRQCNTEQLAEVINKIIEQCFLCGVNENNSKKCIFGSCSRVIEWLKQPHTARKQNDN